MAKGLRAAFPMLWSREAVLEHINAHAHLKGIFDEWRPEEQKEFLAYHGYCG